LLQIIALVFQSVSPGGTFMYSGSNGPWNGRRHRSSWSAFVFHWGSAPESRPCWGSL